jgi:hypothetical protein
MTRGNLNAEIARQREAEIRRKLERRADNPVQPRADPRHRSLRLRALARTAWALMLRRTRSPDLA